MRLDGIQIEHLLSFEHFTWTALDPRFNVIVGPNGAGKTNLFHALRAAVDGVSFTKQFETDWERSVHRVVQAGPMMITLDLQFTEAWEQRLLLTFVSAGLL